MAKKRLTVYMREEDVNWMEQHPIASTISGGAVLALEWAMKQIQRGAGLALEQLDAGERKIIIAYAAKHEFTPDISAATLVSSLGDWSRASQTLPGELSIGQFDKSKFNSLMKKCEEFSPAETLGLLAWARGYWAQEGERDLMESRP